MEHARPPAELSVDGGPVARAEAWRKWRKQFEVFIKASGVSKEPGEVQASLLVNLMGSAGYEIYSTFSYGKDESENDLKCLLKKFDSHFGTKPNVTMARFKFFSRNQESGETVDQFVTALRVLSQTCEFGDLTESLIKDRIVCGISNNVVRDRLLRTDDLTLAKAVQMCEAAELSKEESRHIEEGTGGMKVDAVRNMATDRGGYSGARSGGGRQLRGAGAGGGGGWFGEPAQARRSDGGPSTSTYRISGESCTSCGYLRCAGAHQCPAYDSVCFLCDKIGHFAKVCVHRDDMRQRVLNISVEKESESDEELFYID